MKFFLLFAVLTSNVFANEIVKISDGSVAKCEKKVDVIRYMATLVYRPLSFVITDRTAEVKVEFLKCVQDGEKFRFVPDTNVFDRLVVIEGGPVSREARKIRIEREKFNLVAYRSDDSRTVSKSALVGAGKHTFTAVLNFDPSELQVNRDGHRYFDMTVSNKMKMVDAVTGKIIDSRLDFLGSYRMIIK